MNNNKLIQLLVNSAVISEAFDYDTVFKNLSIIYRVSTDLHTDKLLRAISAF
jgi:hypothetical protein